MPWIERWRPWTAVSPGSDLVLTWVGISTRCAQLPLWFWFCPQSTSWPGRLIPIVRRCCLAVWPDPDIPWPSSAGVSCGSDPVWLFGSVEERSDLLHRLQPTTGGSLRTRGGAPGGLGGQWAPSTGLQGAQMGPKSFFFLCFFFFSLS